jgi:WD40 repeat protein
MRTLVGDTGDVCCLALGRDGNLYSAGSDGAIRVWRGGDGTLLQMLVGHTHIVRALVVGLDGTLFSASGDCTLRVWRFDSGALVHAHTVQCVSAVNTLSIGQSGTLHAGDDEGNVIIW